MAVFASKQIVMPVLHVTVTIIGSGDSDDCYATINGAKRYIEGTHEVNAGDTITFGVSGIASPYSGSVTIDGTQVLMVTSGSTETYDWTVPNDISTIEIVMEVFVFFNTLHYSAITVTTT